MARIDGGKSHPVRPWSLDEDRNAPALISGSLLRWPALQRQLRPH
ncbi:hypothetical protein ACXPIE_004042 [Escherichia coli]